MKLRFLLAVVSLALSLTLSADHKSSDCSGCWIASPEAPTVDQSLGVNIHFIDPRSGEIEMIAKGGFRWVRTDFVWALTERERGQYDFSAYDRLLQQLDAFHIHAFFIFDYGNPLYTDGKAVRTPEARVAFARWAATAAKHYSGRGVKWELFNEPNTKMFWPPQPDAAEYIALANEVNRAFHQATPGEELVGPATSVDLNFLEACLKTNSTAAWTAVSVHPYRQTDPESAAMEYAQLRGLISKYNSGRKAIISSEWGYSSAWSRMNEQRQAVMLAREFLTNLANGISLSIWYDWRDDGADPNEAEDHFGLVPHEYRGGQNVYGPKPAYVAATTLTSSLAGYRFESRVPTGSPNDYVLAFRKDGEQRLVVWTTSAGATRITLPVTNGRWSITGLTGESLGQFTATGSLDLELTGEPKYLIPEDPIRMK
jgi:hypothetical protein